MINLQNYSINCDNEKLIEIQNHLNDLISTDSLDNYIMPDNQGFAIPNEKVVIFEKFINEIIKVYEFIDFNKLQHDVEENEKVFWELIKDYSSTLQKQKNDISEIINKTEDWQKRLFEHTFSNHLLYRSPLQNIEEGFNLKELSSALTVLRFSFNFIFINFRNKNDFINTISNRFGIIREICHFIWELFQDSKEDMRYQAIISKCNSLNASNEEE